MMPLIELELAPMFAVAETVLDSVSDDARAEASAASIVESDGSDGNK